MLKERKSNKNRSAGNNSCGKIPVEAIAQTSCLIYVRRGERKGRKERKSQSRGNGEMEQSASSGRSETESTGRPLNIIFSARENFSLFRSPTIVAAAVFSRGQSWDERRRKEFPLSPFPLLRADCVLSRCQTRRAVTRPVVCQPRREISLKGDPPSPFVPFFLFPYVVDDRVVADERLTR